MESHHWALLLSPTLVAAWAGYKAWRARKREERGELPPLPVEPPKLRESPDTDVVSFVVDRIRGKKASDYYPHVSVLQPLPLLGDDRSRELPTSDAAGTGETREGG